MAIVAKPEVLYQLPGGVLIAHSDHWTVEGFATRPIRKSLENCGLTPSYAARLFLNFASIPQTGDAAEIFTSKRGYPVERVIPKSIQLDKVEAQIAEVHYYPAFIRPGSRITHVLTDTAELILGRRRSGILEVVPTIHRQGKILLDENNRMHITLGRGDIAILPRDVQGNRWLHFDFWLDNKPSFVVLYSAFPVPYGRAKKERVTR